MGDEMIAAGIVVGTLYISLGYLCNIDRLVQRYLLTGLILAYAVIETESSVVVEFTQTLLEYVKKSIALSKIMDLMGIYVLYFSLRMGYTKLNLLRLLTRKKLVNAVGNRVVKDVVLRVPYLRNKLKKQMLEVENHLRSELKGALKSERILQLPKDGMCDEALVALMSELASGEETKWKDGYVSGAVYHGENDHLTVLNKAYELYSVSNPLHADLWPSVMKFEAEIVAMTANLVNGGHEQVCGVLCSGGTESIVLAAKTHRDWYRDVYGITQPNIIAGVTAHAAIDKACHMLGIELIKVPVDNSTFQVDIAMMRKMINGNTILLYGSAPNFPQGTIDDIKQLSKLALQFGIGLHVDCCLGGFILPFARKLKNYDIPVFDFELQGVTSMSCDTHKYGYASKGTSVVLYKNATIRNYQYFCFPEWTGGLYVTPTIAGSRPGALSAACWASLVRIGESGFLKNTKNILDTANAIRRGIHQISGLSVLGDSKAMVH